MRKSIANTVIIFLILCLTMLLGGCGNGGSSEGATTAPGTTPTVSTTVSGVVVDGFISNATIRAYQINANGTKGAQIGAATNSSAAGAYSISLGSYTGPVLLESRGGSFTDWATGATVTLEITDIMNAVVSNATGTVNALITPLTNMAAARAQQDIAVNGTAGATAIEHANTEISRHFGSFDILADTPIDPTVAGSATGASQARVDYSMVLAGLSGNAGANDWQPFSLVTAMALDASDGTFDGKQGGAQLTVATTAGGQANLPVTAGGSDLGAAITAFQSSAQNDSGGTTTPLIITNLNADTGAYSAKPDRPTGLTVSVASSTQINLSWTASAGATGYKIYRDGALLKSVTTTATTDTGLKASTQYVYAVSAYDIDGNESPQTSQKCATTDYSAPPMPTGLTATAVSAVQVDLAWNASAGAKGYNVYRSDLDESGVATGWNILGSVPDSGGATTSVSDMAGTWTLSPLGPSTHMQYCYSVSAFVEEGGSESPRSAAVCLATP